MLNSLTNKNEDSVFMEIIKKYFHNSLGDQLGDEGEGLQYLIFNL